MTAASEPPLLVKPGRPAAAKGVVLGLVLFGFVQLAQNAFAMIEAIRSSRGQIDLLAPFTFLVTWGFAWLVWKDKRVVWPLLAYGSALCLAGLIGATGGAAVGMPPKLWAALWHSDWSWPRIYLGTWLLQMLFLGWLLREAEKTLDDWPAGFRAPSRRWLRPRTFLVGFIFPAALVTFGGLKLLQGPWTAPIVEQARSKYGAASDYYPVRYNFASRNGRTTWHAEVLAYSDRELKWIILDWQN